MPQHAYCPKVPTHGCAVGVARLTEFNQKSIHLIRKIRVTMDELKQVELLDQHAQHQATYPTTCRACRFSRPAPQRHYAEPVAIAS